MMLYITCAASTMCLYAREKEIFLEERTRSIDERKYVVDFTEIG